MISTLDTHETVKSLTAAGFTEAQAEAVTTALKGAVDIDLSNLATKADHLVLRGDFEGLRGDFEGLRGDFEALRSEFTGLRGEFTALRGEFATLRGEFGVLRGEVDAKIERAKTELVKWVVGMGFAQVAMLIALLKLIPGTHL
jgi:hypothetical protein